MNQPRQNVKMNEEAINILKGLSYSQLQLQDQRAKILNSGYFNDRQAYLQMDRKTIQKVYPVDLIHFLSVHRMAASERECQYIIWAAGSTFPYLTPQQFAIYITNGHPQILDQMQNSLLSRNINTADEMIKNYSERSLAKVFQKQIEYYRAIQLLREQFIKSYGFQFNVVIECIDRERRGNINFNTILNFIHRNTTGVEFSSQEFQALCRKLGSKSKTSLSYKELMRAFSPFEPLNFPTYRKQSNIQKAMEYINEQVKLLDIDTYPLPSEDDDRIKKTSTGFQRVVDQFRNPITKGTHINTKYFYDKNYYNELKQYKTQFFDPNKDVKKKLQTDMIGPQYHDHFFSDYYLYLEERNKTEHYYNKFGKRYTYENTINKTLEGKQ